jgi:acyl carrier protein
MSDLAQQLESIVLVVHRRNGGTLQHLDLNLKLLDPCLGLDSLDLAEVIVAIERRFNYAPFDAPVPPRTWAELLAALEQAHGEQV